MYHCVVEKGLLHWDHSSIPAWEITWTEEPGRLQFMGLQRVRHDFATTRLLCSQAGFMSYNTLVIHISIYICQQV